MGRRGNEQFAFPARGNDADVASGFAQGPPLPPRSLRPGKSGIEGPWGSLRFSMGGDALEWHRPFTEPLETRTEKTLVSGVTTGAINCMAGGRGFALKNRLWATASACHGAGSMPAGVCPGWRWGFSG